VFLQSSNHTYLHSADPIIHPNLLLQSCRHQLAKRTENNSVAGQMTDGYNEDRQWNGRWFRVSVFPITYTNRRQAVPLCILLEVLIKPHVFRSMRTKNPMSSTEFTNRWQKKHGEVKQWPTSRTGQARNLVPIQGTVWCAFSITSLTKWMHLRGMGQYLTLLYYHKAQHQNVLA
jgi:hypothetical protein